MRWNRLLIAPAVLLAACTQVKEPFTSVANSPPPGGHKGGCKVGGTTSIWGGTSRSGLCNDGPDDAEVPVPPVVVQPDPSDLDGVPAVIDPVTGAITIPEVVAPQDQAYLWIANTIEGTVSKVDVRTLSEVARYQSSRVCSNTTGALAFDDATVCNTFDPTAVMPSRTAIDGNGDAFVGNRAFGLQATVTKFGVRPASCIDRNGNGTIETSNGSTLVANDECVLWTVPVGGKKDDAIARGIAIGPTLQDNPDATDAVWVGLYNDRRAVRLRNYDGKTMETFSLNLYPYGAAIDGSNRAWFVGRGPSAVQYVLGPPCTGGGCVSPRFSVPSSVLNCPAYSGSYLYGIAVDRRGRVYAQGSECNATYQFTPAAGVAPTSGTWRKILLPGVMQGRGVAVQVWSETFPSGDRARSRMWVTNYDQWAWSAWAQSFATSFDGDKLGCDRDVDGVLDSVDPDIENTLNLLTGAHLANTCDYNQDGLVNALDADPVSFVLPNAIAYSPIGIGIDPLDSRYVWTANQDGYVTRFDAQSSPAAPNIVRVRVGPNPYTYSDFTGSAHANITSRFGRARTAYSASCADGKTASWTELDWTADVPLNTRVVFHLRLADKDYDGSGVIDIADLAAAPEITHEVIDPVTGMPITRSGWIQSLMPADPAAADQTPISINEAPANLTALQLPASNYAQLDIELFSSAEQSPVIKELALRRTCN